MIPCRMLCLLLAGVLVLCVDQNVSAQLLFRAEVIDGPAVSGQLVDLTPDHATLENDSGEKSLLSLNNLIALTQLPKTSRKFYPVAGQPWVFLETGDRLCVSPTAIDDSTLTASWSRFEALAPVEIPLEVCRGAAFSLTSEPLQQGLLVSSITKRTEASDLVVLRNGDQLKGELLGLAGGDLKIETSLGEIAPKAQRVERLAFNPELVFAEKPQRRFAMALLSDGSVLNLSRVTCDGLSIKATMLCGTKIGLPLDVIHELRIAGGRAVPLSQISPSSTDIRPFLDTRRQPQWDQNVLGGFLSMNGRPRVIGVGVASGTTLEWNLDGSWRTFRATVGIDDAAAGRGSVVFEIQLDGRQVWKSSELTGKSKPISIPEVDLTQANRLTLKTHFGQQGNVLDYANWADAILISKSE